MSAFGGLYITNKGRALQAKAQAGAQLNFTRIGIGDGSLSGQSISDLTALISQKKSLSITKCKVQSVTNAVVGSVLSNQDMAAGFYFREIGVFAQDPDIGEILYCYGNAGANAEYIPAGGGSDIVEKNVDVVTIVGNATSVTATIDSSMIYASVSDLQAHTNDMNNPHHVTAAQIGALPSTAGSATDTIIGNRTADSTQVPTGLTGAFTQWISWFTNRIKAITGTPNWYDAPPTTLTAASTHMSNTNNPHNVTAAQVGAVPVTDKGVANGVATLGADGHLPPTQIPLAGVTIGGVKQGTGLTIAADGTISVLGTTARTDVAQTWTAIQIWAAGQTFAWSAISGKPTTVATSGLTDAVSTSMIGAANGVAGLDASGQVPKNQLGNVPPSNTLTMPNAWIG